MTQGLKDRIREIVDDHLVEITAERMLEVTQAEYHTMVDRLADAQMQALSAVLDDPATAEILRNALYRKHPQQTEEERVQAALAAIRQKLEGV